MSSGDVRLRRACACMFFPTSVPRDCRDSIRRDVQGLADRLLADRKDPSTVRNALMPLRVIYRRAVREGTVHVNPCTGIDLPAVRGRRDRIAAPSEAAALIAALRPDDRALWGAAFYAGLRMGELRALRWSDIDMAGGLIRVERSLDHQGTTVAPKSRAGHRVVPIPRVLRSLLATHRHVRVGEGYAFGSSLTRPFNGMHLCSRPPRLPFGRPGPAGRSHRARRGFGLGG